MATYRGGDLQAVRAVEHHSQSGRLTSWLRDREVLIDDTIIVVVNGDSVRNAVAVGVMGDSVCVVDPVTICIDRNNLPNSSTCWELLRRRRLGRCAGGRHRKRHATFDTIRNLNDEA